jgi:hypothetical protein
MAGLKNEERGIGRVLVVLGIGWGVLACAPKTEDNTNWVPPVMIPDAAVNETPSNPSGVTSDAGTQGPGATPGANPPAAGMDSGTMQGGAADGAADTGSALQLDASAIDAAGGNDAGSTGGADSGEGGTLTGPLALPEPALPGPFEVVVEENVGKGFENAIDTNDMPGNNKYCEDFALSFGQDEAQSKEFAKIPAGMNMALYTLYRPANFEPGKKYPILSWGNGTCALPQGYANLLRHLASHGFWVIAANTRFTGSGAAQKKGIDVMIALNKDASHAAYERVDADKVGLFGHSQGGLSTSAASADTRADTAVILNSGGGGSRIPTYYVTGEEDLAPFLSELSYDLASAPAASINYKKSDHITLITEPMRVYPAVTAWFRYQLLGDAVGKEYFVGTNCKLCNRASEWSFRAKNLK